MTTPQLSVIIPVYNVQKYINRCLESIINQSFKDLEIIVVNDCSPDETSLIVDDIRKKYSSTNIQQIHLKNNGGIGNARNIGLDHATGKYVNFIDGDDWLDFSFYFTMITEMERNNGDIAVGGVRTEYNNAYSAKTRYYYPQQNTISGSYALKLLSHVHNNNAYITPMVGNKVFNRSFVLQNHLTFAVDTYNEDDLFTFCSFVFAKTVLLIPDIEFHYYQRENSITHTFSKKHIDGLLQTFVKLREFLSERNLLTCYKDEYNAFFEKCITSTLNNLFSTEQSAVCQKKYITYFAEEFTKYFSLKECIEYLDVQRIKDFFYI